MNIAQRRDHVLKILRRRNRYQFGQPKSSYVGNSGCTDTSIQMIVLMAKGKRVSLNRVRQASGAPHGKPMKVSQALRALRAFGLDYEYRSGLSAAQLLNIASRRGPVIVGEMYWAHPQWQGYRYAGRVLHGIATNASGKRIKVGVARPVRRSGLTQWTFRGGHGILVATDTYLMVNGKRRRHGVVRDPNHNSPVRPERPAFDVVTLQQLNRMIRSWPGTGTLALVPKKVVVR